VRPTSTYRNFNANLSNRNSLWCLLSFNMARDWIYFILGIIVSKCFVWLKYIKLYVRSTNFRNNLSRLWDFTFDCKIVYSKKRKTEYISVINWERDVIIFINGVNFEVYKNRE
jgi:hypothetical protein